VVDRWDLRLQVLHSISRPDVWSLHPHYQRTTTLDVQPHPIRQHTPRAQVHMSYPRAPGAPGVQQVSVIPSFCWRGTCYPDGSVHYTDFAMLVAPAMSESTAYLPGGGWSRVEGWGVEIVVESALRLDRSFTCSHAHARARTRTHTRTHTHTHTHTHTTHTHTPLRTLIHAPSTRHSKRTTTTGYTLRLYNTTRLCASLVPETCLRTQTRDQCLMYYTDIYIESRNGGQHDEGKRIRTIVGAVVGAVGGACAWLGVAGVAYCAACCAAYALAVAVAGASLATNTRSSSTLA